MCSQFLSYLEVLGWPGTCPRGEGWGHVGSGASPTSLMPLPSPLLGSLLMPPEDPRDPTLEMEADW